MRKGVKTAKMALALKPTTKWPIPFENLAAALGGMILVDIYRSIILYQKCNFWQRVQYCFRARVGFGNQGKLSSFFRQTWIRNKVLVQLTTFLDNKWSSRPGTFWCYLVKACVSIRQSDKPSCPHRWVLPAMWRWLWLSIEGRLQIESVWYLSRYLIRYFNWWNAGEIL